MSESIPDVPSASLTASLTHFQQVGEFHLTFGHPLRTSFYYDALTTDRKLADFRLSLMREELKEFEEAYAKNDRVEMADALCDLLYVTYGAGHALGIDLGTKPLNPPVSVPKTVNIKSDKSAYEITWFMGTINAYLNDYNSYSNIYNGMKVDDNDIFKFIKFLPEEKRSSVTNDIAMGSLIYQLQGILNDTYYLGYKLGFDMDLMFREVHRSNMTKVCDNEDDAKASVEFYVKDGRYKDPQYRLQGKYYVIYDAATSKILKNHRWNTPDLKQFFT
jgi:predicted HAD superfamily Cof-like phosphohydrolase